MDNSILLRIFGSFYLAFGLFGIWFIFHVRSELLKKNGPGNTYDTFFLFLFPIAIIIGTGIANLFDYRQKWLDDAIYFWTPAAWVVTFATYEAFVCFKNRNAKKENIQKDKGR